jgi:hypothetical protein
MEVGGPANVERNENEKQPKEPRERRSSAAPWNPSRRQSAMIEGAIAIGILAMVSLIVKTIASA